MAEPLNEQTVQARDPKGWYVTYTVAGFGTFQVGPYFDIDEVFRNKRDIEGYEGVEDVNMCAPKPKADEESATSPS